MSRHELGKVIVGAAMRSIASLLAGFIVANIYLIATAVMVC